MIWLFDLDNTLHNASWAIFPKISANMNAYLMQYGQDGNKRLLSEEEANRLRIEYWKRFGATLLGVSKVLNRQAEDFLGCAHRFDDLSSLIDAEKGLPFLLGNLPGKKVLLTNSAYHYSREMLRLLKLSHFFDGHVAIENMRVFGVFEPKPSKKFFRKLLASLKIRPGNCVLVDDNTHILKTAKTMGMKTVLVTKYLNTYHGSEHAYPFPFGKRQTGRPAYVDLKVPSVRALIRYRKYFC